MDFMTFIKNKKKNKILCRFSMIFTLKRAVKQNEPKVKTKLGKACDCRS